jgi:hypothetical protein
MPKWFETLLYILGALGSIAAISMFLLDINKRIRKFYENRHSLKQNLQPYIYQEEMEEYSQHYIQTKYQKSFPSETFEQSDRDTDESPKKLIPFFLKEIFKNDRRDQRLYIILAASGWGKTAFMINLYLKYGLRWSGKHSEIKYIAMDYQRFDEEIKDIEDKKKKNTILLLDAFDEDHHAEKDYFKRLNEIIEKTNPFRKVIITSRPQFFLSEKESSKRTVGTRFRKEKEYHQWCVLYISSFDQKDIKKYLRKKISFLNRKKKRKAFDIVKSSKNLIGCPILLNNINDLLKEDKTYKNSFQIYEVLTEKWAVRVAVICIENTRENFINKWLKFSRSIAVYIYRYRKSRKGLIINKEEVDTIAQKNQIQLEVIQFRSPSLLKRNAVGKYKFVHKSILEYFLAVELYENHELKKDFDYKAMPQVENFYNGMLNVYPIKFLTQKNAEGEQKLIGTFRLDDKPRIDQKLSEIENKDMENLFYLGLKGNRLNDISFIEELTTLKRLDLVSNQLANISPLKELKELTELHLSDNRLTDITILKEMKDLEELHLDHNQLTDISALREMKRLERLDLSNNKLTDISALKGIKGLKELNLSNNRLKNLSVLRKMKELGELYLTHNKITNINALKDLNDLWYLDIRNNDLSPEQIEELRKAIGEKCTING